MKFNIHRKPIKFVEPGEAMQIEFEENFEIDFTPDELAQLSANRPVLADKIVKHLLEKL